MNKTYALYSYHLYLSSGIDKERIEKEICLMLPPNVCTIF